MAKYISNEPTVDDEWMKFLCGGDPAKGTKDAASAAADCESDDGDAAPEADLDLYISTKTIVLYLNQAIDIHTIFWEIPISPYSTRAECVIKKQMKIVSKSREEYETYRAKLATIPYYNEHVIKQIDEPTARRIKFKDERKITVGLSKKDIMVCRGKAKSAFYNCFAMIFRFKIGDDFKEIHVKVFNTGKLEIPGILNNALLENVKRMVLKYIQPHVQSPLEFVEQETEENVLINSNFNCGFFVNRAKLYTILRNQYRVEASYDPCSYPGVKCKFYYLNDAPASYIQDGQVLEEDRTMKLSDLIESNKYTAISFMVFRTGSCLIVGNCAEIELMRVYDYVKQILLKERSKIIVLGEEVVVKQKKPKLRKKMVQMTVPYYAAICRDS